MTTCPDCHRSSCPTTADDDFRAKHDCAMAQVQSLKDRRAEELLGFRQWLMAFERAAVELAALRAERDDTLAARDAAILHMHEAQEQLAAVVAQRDEARAEIARLTEQQAFVSGKLDGSRAVRARLDAAIAAADTALDDARAPRERDGRTLTLAERIAAALPLLPEPAREWMRGRDQAGWFWYREILRGAAGYLVVSVVARDGMEPNVVITNSDKTDARVLAGAILCALGRAGIPPTEKP